MNQNEADRKLCEEGQRLLKLNDGSFRTFKENAEANRIFEKFQETAFPELCSRLLARVAEAEEMRGLLERAPVRCRYGDLCSPPFEKRCEGCAWNAERKQSLAGWEGEA